MGWDSARLRRTVTPPDFNPPTPCGVGRYRTTAQKRLPTFQSTHPVWGGTGSISSKVTFSPISIHPPRVGWDIVRFSSGIRLFNFNPPTPCGVGPVVFFTSRIAPSFQSTHPVWGGTDELGHLFCAHCISIHPPRVGWDGVTVRLSRADFISIHPPRVGWDLKAGYFHDEVLISIHPPRVGWDTS